VQYWKPGTRAARWGASTLIVCAGAFGLTHLSRAAQGAHAPVAASPFAMVASSEIPVDQAILAPSGGQVAPRIAASNSGYLVVWAGSVAGRTDLLAERLDTSGQLIDPTPIVVYTFWSSEVGSPVVASDGTDYFVAWNDDLTYGIAGTRIRASDGAVLDTPFPLVSGGGYGPALTCVNGTYVLAYWQNAGGNIAIRTERIQNGATLDALPGVLVATVPSTPNYTTPSLDIAAGPGQVFVVWGAYGVRENVSTGSVLDATPIQFANMVAGAAPHAAYDGTANYQMVWDDGSSTIWGGRVRASDGTPLDPDDTFNKLPGSKKLRTQLQLVANSIRVAATDQKIAVTYGTKADAIYALAVDPAVGTAITQQDAGTDPLIAKAIFLPATPNSDFALGASSTANVVYESLTGNGGAGGGTESRILAHAAGQLTDGSGSSPVYLSVAGQTSWPGAASSDGTDYLVAWTDDRAASAGAYASRVSAATHTSLDPQGLALASGAAVTPHSIASSGSEYLFAWIGSGYTVQARTIANGGTLGAPFTVYTGYSYNPPSGVAVGYDGTNYFVVWFAGSEVLGARVNTTTHAIVDTTPINIAYPGTPYASLGVTVDDTSDPTRKTFLVAWMNSTTTASGTTYGLECARVRAYVGSAVDVTSPIKLSSNVFGGRAADVTSDGTNFLVAWSEMRTGTLGEAVFGTRIVPLDASILDKQGTTTGVLLADSSDNDYLDAASWDGVDYVLAWTHSGNTFSAPYLPVEPLSFSRLTSSRAPLDPMAGVSFEQQAISNGVTDTVLATNGHGELIAPYAVFSSYPGQLGQRIRARLLEDDGVVDDAGVWGWPVEAGADGGDGAVDAGEAGHDAGDLDASADTGPDAQDAAESGVGQTTDAGNDATVADATAPGASDAGGSRDGAAGDGDADGAIGGGPAGGGDAADVGGPAAAGTNGCGCQAAGLAAPIRGSGVLLLGAAIVVLRRRRRRE
jgi:hypothetical protein